jgi:hypothetical protein
MNTRADRATCWVTIQVNPSVRRPRRWRLSRVSQPCSAHSKIHVFHRRTSVPPQTIPCICVKVPLHSHCTDLAATTFMSARTHCPNCRKSSVEDANHFLFSRTVDFLHCTVCSFVWHVPKTKDGPAGRELLTHPVDETAERTRTRRWPVSGS